MEMIIDRDEADGIGFETFACGVGPVTNCCPGTNATRR